MKRILAATDFSTRSDRALRRAILIAGECDAALTLVHVVDDDQPAGLIDAQRAAAADLLGQIARNAGEVDGVSVETVVTAGDPFAGILRTADQTEADLIVIGPHRRQLLDVFTGTTAERTIRRSGRPVLMANAVPSGPYAHSLLAVDFDEASRSAADAARRLGLIGRTEIVALHLFDAPALGMMRRAMETPETIDQYLGAERDRADRRLAAFLATAGLDGVRPLLRPDQGAPAAAILAAAREMESDLIVVGTNQRTGLKRFLLGSVAREILLDSDRDVLVVPPAPGADWEAAR